MSTDRSTEALLAELAHDARPVRPIASPARAAAGVLGVWLASALVEWTWLGAAPRFGAGHGFGDAAYAVLFAGLGVAAVAGLAAVLVRREPGRDTAVRVAQAGLAFGVGLALGAAALSALVAPRPGALPPSASLVCLARAAALSLLPALGLWALLARGFEPRPRVGAAVAGLTALALGALVVHASCVTGDALHRLAGHAAGPLALALLASLPAAAWLRRRAA